MNSNYNKSTSGSLNNFNFDFGMGSTRSTKSLNDQKNQATSSSSFSYSTSTTQPKPVWQPNKPSWTHQPAPAKSTQTGLNGPATMVGDIFGKTWNSTDSGCGIGIVEKNPNLFGDLVNSAIGGQGNKANSNVPLKNAAPIANKSPYSMGNLGDSLPKVNNLNSSGVQSSGYNRISNNFSSKVNNNASPNLGGPSMKSMSGSGGIGGGIAGNKDPFGSLVDFGSKDKSGSLNSAIKNNKTVGGGGDDGFEDFQNASKSNASSFPSTGFGTSNNDFVGSKVGTNTNVDDFGMFERSTGTPQNQPPSQTSAGDPLDMFFTPSSGSGATNAGGVGGQQFGEVDDWGLDSGFGGNGHDDGGATTELEGLPPPPAGVTASAAKSKGIDNQKQGQYADAIKWLSWAVVLLEKSGDAALMLDVLSSRASCYKEVGEYKKAVADCTKVLEHDGENVTVLVQRALLYESMEKYRLGAEDLRTVLKVDPTNRIARSTIHRLNKMAD